MIEDKGLDPSPGTMTEKFRLMSGVLDLGSRLADAVLAFNMVKVEAGEEARAAAEQAWQQCLSVKHLPERVSDGCRTDILGVHDRWRADWLAHLEALIASVDEIVPVITADPVYGRYDAVFSAVTALSDKADDLRRLVAPDEKVLAKPSRKNDGTASSAGTGHWRVTHGHTSLGEPLVAVVDENDNVITDNEPYYPKALDPAIAPLIAAAPTMRELLEPLAQLAASYGDHIPDDHAIFGKNKVGITLGYCRRVAHVLNATGVTSYDSQDD